MLKTKSKLKSQNSKINNTSSDTALSHSANVSAKGTVGSKQAMTMADLLKSTQPTFVTLHRGDIVNGVITKLTPKEIFVDVQAKSEAVVLEKDKRLLRSILSQFRVGDTVDVSILSPESDMGYPVVSLRRFLDEKLWGAVAKAEQERKPIRATIREATKGGYLVETENGLNGFLPNSQVTVNTLGSDLIGKKIDLYVVEQNRKLRKLILSQKPVLGIKDFDELVKQLHAGDKISAIITSIIDFGMFVSIPVFEDRYVDGLLHISEISWDEQEGMLQDYAVGDTIEAVILGFDRDAKRVDLSIKQLTTDPFEELVKDVVVDQRISGEVTTVNPHGVTVSVTLPNAQTIEGFIRKDKIPPTKKYEVGEAVSATVAQIDTKKHRVILVPVLTAKPIGYR